MKHIVFVIALIITPQAKADTFWEFYEGSTLPHNNSVTTKLPHFNGNVLAITGSHGGDIGARIPPVGSRCNLSVEARILVSSGCASVGIDHHANHILAQSNKHCSPEWVEKSSSVRANPSLNLYGVVRIDANSVVEIDYLEIKVDCTPRRRFPW